jgi:hypothetical protein
MLASTSKKRRFSRQAKVRPSPMRLAQLSSLAAGRGRPAAFGGLCSWALPLVCWPLVSFELSVFGCCSSMVRFTFQRLSLTRVEHSAAARKKSPIIVNAVKSVKKLTQQYGRVCCI